MVRNMTEGDPLKLILPFMVPLLIGNVFQQLYNIADIIIVGRTIGVNALAAVGATAPLFMMLVVLTMGLSNGFTVVTGQRYGAGDLHDGLFGIRRRGIQARRRGLPAQTLLVRRLQPLGSQGQFALRTPPQPAPGAGGGIRGAAQRQGVYLGEGRLQGFAGEDQRHRLSRKRRRIRAHAPRRRNDHHHAVPAQEHGDGASFGVVHARAPFVHRQPAHDQGLRQRAHLPQRHGVRTDRRELQGSLPGIYRQEFPKFVAIRPGGDQVPPSTGKRTGKRLGKTDGRSPERSGKPPRWTYSPSRHSQQ